MISEEQVAHIRHLFHAEHWKIGTIAAQLGLHPETVRAALDTDRFRSHPRPRLTDPYLSLLHQTLHQYRHLRATHAGRGHSGGRDRRPRRREESGKPADERPWNMRPAPGFERYS